MTKVNILKKEDKFKYLGDKICKFVKYYEKERGQKILSIAALVDILFAIKEIFKSYDKRFKKLEEHNLEHHEINETGGINKIKIVLEDPILKKERT